ncbi:MAG TPA: hypothetical protein HA362_07925 [Nanoarchaeota archaeon]|nr:hypothetical protein [Nanoarchaeota archaeon]
MELHECIEKRRSIRHYLPKEVPLETLGEIMDHARLAPSAGNAQNWRFVIVTEPAIKKEVAEICYNQHWMTEAPVHIVLCNSHKKLTTLYKDTGKMFGIQDCAIIGAYIQLLAVDRGLGTCWVGAFDAEKLHGLLRIADDVKVEAVITLGWPDEVKHIGQIRNEFTDLCYFEKWGNKEARKEGFSLKEKVKSSSSLIKGLFKKQ